MTDPLLEQAVDVSEDGRRIDVLVSHWLDEPRGRTQARIAAGEVLADGVAVVKSHRAAAGEIVVVSQPAPEDVVELHEAVPIRWRDEHLAVVAKPAGLVVHRGAGTRHRATLVDVLRDMGIALAGVEDPDRPGIVHRLDRGTSGLLVVASSAAAREGLVELFKRHDVDRQYWAIVDGHPQPPSATIDAPIARATRNRTKFRVDSAGRRAVTHYDVVSPGPGASIVTARLETGRTHQVRVHMAAIGHPVSGDRTYGASNDVAHRLTLSRLALHAERLGFTHPVTGERVEVVEPLPPDLTAARSALLDR